MGSVRCTSHLVTRAFALPRGKGRCYAVIARRTFVNEINFVDHLSWDVRFDFIE